MDEDVDDEMIRDVVDVIENDKGLDNYSEMNNRSGAMAMEESKE